MTDSAQSSQRTYHGKVICTGCDYSVRFQSRTLAEHAAEIHQEHGKEHVTLLKPMCEMPDCENTENLTTCVDPENNQLEMCPDCRSAWPVEPVSTTRDMTEP